MTRIFTVIYVMLCVWLILMGKSDARLLGTLSLAMVILAGKPNVEKKVIVPEYAPHQRTLTHDDLKRLRDYRLTHKVGFM